MKKFFRTKDKRAVTNRINLFNKENWLPEWFKYIQQNTKRILPAVESCWIPRTNNMAERFFREFNRFYGKKGGFSSVESCRKHCNLFFLWYNFKTYSRDARKEIRGLSPLELHAPDIVRMPFYQMLNFPDMNKLQKLIAA